MKWVGLIAAVAVVVLIGYIAVPHGADPKPGNERASGPNADSHSAPAVQYTVVLDVSASRAGQMIGAGEEYVDTLIANMHFGDRLVLLQMAENGVEHPESQLAVTFYKSEEISSLEEGEALAASRRRLSSTIHEFFLRAEQSPVQQTDILSTLSIASEQISPGRQNSLILLSDMLQSDKKFEFEGLKRMPPVNWIVIRKKEGLIRPLDGVCVLVIGADPSTEQGATVRDFWEKYFQASDATLREANYRTTPPIAPPVCR